MQRKNKKQMNYYQAFKYFQLEPYGDVDKDGVPNFLDCRPFDSEKHFIKLSDVKNKFKRSKPTVETREPLSRSPQPSKYKPPKKVYLYVKINGKWKLYGAFDEGTSLPFDEVNKLYKQGLIESHELSDKPNEARRLNLEEKVKPVAKHTKEWVDVSKKHIKEEVPKLAKKYQKRVGFTKGELGKRVREGLEFQPSTFHLKQRYEDEDDFEMDEPEIEEFGEEIPEIEQKEINVPEERTQMPQVPQGIEISSQGISEIQPRQINKSMPPVSKGWAWSIGGSRPYRPAPYRPTGKVIFRDEKNYNPNPKIPFAKIPMYKDEFKIKTVGFPYANVKTLEHKYMR